MVFRGSRLLNDFGESFGLNISDLVLILGSFVTVFLLLEPIGLSLGAFFIAASITASLIPLRLSCRRHTIRDFLLDLAFQGRLS